MLDYGARVVISQPTLLLWGDSDNIHVPFSTTDDHRACCMHACTVADCYFVLLIVISTVMW
jgi:hypothetical protein